MDYTKKYELFIDSKIEPTRLYIKKHTKTGMMYFGKTKASLTMSFSYYVEGYKKV